VPKPPPPVIHSRRISPEVQQKLVVDAPLSRKQQRGASLGVARVDVGVVVDEDFEDLGKIGREIGLRALIEFNNYHEDIIVKNHRTIINTPCIAVYPLRFLIDGSAPCSHMAATDSSHPM